MSRLKKRADGLYQVSCTVTVDGKKRRKYFYARTQKEARAKMDAWQMARQEEIDLGPLFEKVLDSWQEKHWPEIALNTQRAYESQIPVALSDFGGWRIREIHPLDVKRAIDALAARGYARQTVSHYRTMLNQIFDHAILLGILEQSPMAAVHIPKGLPSTKREAPGAEVLQSIRDNVDHPFGLVPYMLLYTGLRRGELLALQWRDIDFERRLISVSKSVTYTQGGTPQIKSPKTAAGVRTVILLDRLALRLNSVRGKPDEYVFGGKIPMRIGEFKASWRRYCLETGLYREETVSRSTKKQPDATAKIKIPTLTAHQLRHAYITMCYDLGLAAKDTQSLVGHSNIAVTMDIYTHLSEQRKEAVATKLNRAK